MIRAQRWLRGRFVSAGRTDDVSRRMDTAAPCIAPPASTSVHTRIRAKRRNASGNSWRSYRCVNWPL